MEDEVTRAKRWRMRAEELRNIANGLSDGDARRQLLGAAREWEEMAMRAERRSSSKPKPISTAA
jgi:hypothetical protein